MHDHNAQQTASQNARGRRVGVLLAAGRGRRMGGGKLELAWPMADGETPLLIASARGLARCCDELLIVLGHDAQRLRALLDEYRPAERMTTIDADPDAPMFESFRVALDHLSSMRDAIDVVILHPADHPVITMATAEALIAAFNADPSRAVMPEYAGRGGHPVFIPAGLLDALRAYSGDGGLRAYWRANPDACCRIPVDDPWVRVDLDTPEDVAGARQHIGTREVNRTERS